ncbi:MAG: hypothetical protein INR69_07095 [Mucilaginibacter polytrichastri]|nr:hypothetical protein [Mucilaginibacter polytrichastri]
MFSQKIRSGSSGLLLYGITPPKSETTAERVAEIAERTIGRLQALDIDALVVYDVQDESARTADERPFPFLKAIDPFEYADGYLHGLDIPKIIYRPAGKFTRDELTSWLGDLDRNGFHPVFVGVPAPDYPVKTSLPDAYAIWKEAGGNTVIGAVTIPERHHALGDEDQRILAKMASGVSYFISQCVFNVAYAKQLVDDLAETCSKEGKTCPTLIFTLTACGSLKTLKFMEWLGIDVPESLKEDLNRSPNILQQSVDMCISIATELTAYCRQKEVPFGFNIESVSIRKEEIEASVGLVTAISNIVRDQKTTIES